MAGKDRARKTTEAEARWLRAFIRKRCKEGHVALQSLGPKRQGTNLLYEGRYAYSKRNGIPFHRALDLVSWFLSSRAGKGVDAAEVYRRSGIVRLAEESPTDEAPLVILDDQAENAARDLVGFLRFNGYVSRKHAKNLVGPIAYYFDSMADWSADKVPSPLMTALREWRDTFRQRSRRHLVIEGRRISR